MRFKKILASVLAVAMSVGMLTACGGSSSSTAASSKAASTASSAAASSTAASSSAEKVEINFVAAQYSDKTEAYLEGVIADFEKANPNVKVNLEVIGWDTISETMTSKVGAKQAPDIYNGGSASEFQSDGILYTADDVISDKLKADFYSNFLDNCTDPDSGIMYSIPFLASVRALYYNKKIFKEVGITEAPKTWTDVEADCAKIKEHYNGSVYGWGIDATTTEGQTMVAYYGWNNGGGYVDDKGNYILNSAGNVGGLEWAYNLYKNGYTNENPCTELRDDMQKMVVADKMAMLITACFFPALYPDAELGIAPIPYNDKTCSESSTLGVQDTLIFFNDKVKSEKDTPAKMKAISDFLDFFYAADRYTQFMIQEGLLPATQSGAKKLVEIDPNQAAYIDALKGAKFYSRNKSNWTDATKALIDGEQKVFTGQMTPQEALDEAQAAVAG